MLKPYGRVRLLTDRYADQGVRVGSLGYVIEVYPDGAYEVEFSAPDGTTIAQIVAQENELAADPEVP